jgi:hypothetical protein
MCSNATAHGDRHAHFGINAHALSDADRNSYANSNTDGYTNGHSHAAGTYRKSGPRL